LKLGSLTKQREEREKIRNTESLIAPEINELPPPKKRKSACHKGELGERGKKMRTGLIWNSRLGIEEAMG